VSKETAFLGYGFSSRRINGIRTAELLSGETCTMSCNTFLQQMNSTKHD